MNTGSPGMSQKTGRRIVGVADMAISSTPGDTIITHALGSCLGIIVYDPVVKVGGLLHVMLPQSSIDPAKAASNPSMFVDTGVPRLFKECYKLGAKKEKMIIKVAGGAAINENPGRDGEAGGGDFFKIGKRNFVMLRKLLWKNGVLIEAHDVGSNISRTLQVEIATGAVTVSSRGNKTSL